MESVVFKIVGIDLVLRAYSAYSMYFTIMSALALQTRMPTALSFRVGKVGDFGLVDFSCDSVLPATMSLVTVADLRERRDALWQAMQEASKIPV